MDELKKEKCRLVQEKEELLKKYNIIQRQIIKIENPTFQIFDKLQRVPTEYEFEISASVHSVNTIVAGKITEDDDGLDGWLIDEHVFTPPDMHPFVRRYT